MRHNNHKQSGGGSDFYRYIYLANIIDFNDWLYDADGA